MPPPRHIIVEYKNREVVLSRAVIQKLSMKRLFQNLTTIFSLAQKDETVRHYDQPSRLHIEYRPMVIYATFYHGDSVDNVFREIPDWDPSWLDLVPSVDRIRVMTISQHYEERLKREGDQSLGNRLGDENHGQDSTSKQITDLEESEHETGSGGEAPQDGADEEASSLMDGATVVDGRTRDREAN